MSDRPGPFIRRSAPFFVSPTCKGCGKTLVLVDEGEPETEIWYDEWICPSWTDKEGPCHGIVMDWPDEAWDELLEKEGIPWE